MGRRHDWTLRPELMRRKAVPVGNWPTVADIPPGALVRDSDGVVKECRWVFNNAGNDWVDCGRPTWLSQLRPSFDVFSICAVFMPATLPATSRIYSLEDVSGSQTQFSLIPRSTGGIYSRLGGSSASIIHTGVISGKWYSHTLNAKVPVANSTSVLNGSSVILLTPGSYASTSNLFIGAYSQNPTGEKFDGYIAIFKVCDGNGAIIDTLDFNKWDGSGTVYFDSGHACTVTDGTPFTARAKALVPLSLLS